MSGPRTGRFRTKERGYSYEGKVTLHDEQGRTTVFDVAGFLYGRSQEDAAWQVADELRTRISKDTPLGEDHRPPGAS